MDKTGILILISSILTYFNENFFNKNTYNKNMAALLIMSKSNKLTITLTNYIIKTNDIIN